MLEGTLFFIKIALVFNSDFMAKSKKAISAKTSSKPKRKSGKGLNPWSKTIIFIFIAIALILLVIRFVSKCERSKTTEDNSIEKVQVATDVEKEKDVKDNHTAVKNEPKKQVEETQKKLSDNQRDIDVPEEITQKYIEGCWLSFSEGSSLTMKKNTYRIDFSGVESSEPIEGKYKLEKDIVTFTTTDGPCEKVIGKYRVKLVGEDIKFVCKSDDCLKRKNALVSEWEWFTE